MDFSRCNPDQTWILRKATSGSTWFTLVDERGRSVASITGKGSVTFTIKIDAAAARRYSGTRTGSVYLSSFSNGRAGITIALYQFTQPIPKL